MIQDGKINMIEKTYNKKFKQQTIMDFLVIKFGPYFQKSLSWSFFVGLIFFSPNVKELFGWATFPMDFISWLLTT